MALSANIAPLLLLSSIAPFVVGQLNASVAGRLLATNCPPLNPQPAAAQDTGTLACQWIISIDNRGCRQISQECGMPPRCNRPNEILWQCSSLCEPSCANRNPNCANQCGAPQCQCAPGSFRNQAGVCVPQGQCTATQPQPNCKFGEVLVRQNCSSLTCESRCDGRLNCNRECNQLMCLCANGFFRNERNNQCVSRNQCSVGNDMRCVQDNQCPGSTICSNGRCISGCTSHSQCDQGLLCQSGRCVLPVCENDNHCDREFICQGLRCTPGCRSTNNCRNGFQCVNNQCVENRPQPQCRRDNECSGNNQICLNGRCQRGCRSNFVCSSGFACINFECRRSNNNNRCSRDSQCRRDETCVRGECRRMPCDSGEEFVQCASACEPTCFNRHPSCTLQCLTPRCQCQRGYVRNSHGKCIRADRC